MLNFESTAMKNQSIKLKAQKCLKSKYVLALCLGLLTTLVLFEREHYLPSSRADVPAREDLEAPFLVDNKTGTTWNIFGLEIVGKVMSEQTNGKYAVVISTTPPSGGPPLHVHQHEDEMFYVLAGTYEFRFGNETAIATQGDLIHLPRSIPHSFANIGSEPGVMMNTITPGGFEKFFEEIARLPKERPLERQQVAEIASKYGLRFLPESN
jgi:quercetin dioxygenase-like cupin family protein